MRRRHGGARNLWAEPGDLNRLFGAPAFGSAGAKPRPVVRPTTSDVAGFEPKTTERRGAGAELVADDGIGDVAQALQQPPHQLKRHLPVAARLDENVGHLAWKASGRF